MKNPYIKACPSCGAENNPFMAAGGENDTPYAILFTAEKQNNGSYTPVTNKGLAVMPIVCVNCNHVMLFKAD
jgi:hypothetical protein